MLESELLEFSTKGGIGACITITESAIKDQMYLNYTKGMLVTILLQVEDSIYFASLNKTFGLLDLKNTDIIYYNVERFDKIKLSNKEIREFILSLNNYSDFEEEKSLFDHKRISSSTAPAVLDTTENSVSRTSLSRNQTKRQAKLLNDSRIRTFHDLEESNSFVDVLTVETKKEKNSTISKIRKKFSEAMLSKRIDPSLVFLPSSAENPRVTTNFDKYTDLLNKENTDKRIIVDQYGFIVESKEALTNSDDGSFAKEEEEQIDDKIEEVKSTKWINILKKWNSSKARKSYRVKKLVETGCPYKLRGKIWCYLANVKSFKNKTTMKGELDKPFVSYYDEIDKDIRRTYPRHAMFKENGSQGQESLMKILRAYSQYNPKIGYCQGMGMLVGLMLMQGIEEEDAFFLLIATVDQYLQGYFTPTLSQLQIHAKVFERLLKKYDHHMYKYLQQQEANSLLYVTRWFLTVYTITLPWASVLRVWDLFYYKGIKILFKVGLAIMKCIKNYVFNTDQKNFEILPFLMHIPPELVSPEKLMKAYEKIDFKTKEIKKYCSEVNLEQL